LTGIGVAKYQQVFQLGQHLYHRNRIDGFNCSHNLFSCGKAWIAAAKAASFGSMASIKTPPSIFCFNADSSITVCPRGGWLPLQPLPMARGNRPANPVLPYWRGGGVIGLLEDGEQLA
jgi:hypothetical protein